MCVPGGVCGLRAQDRVRLGKGGSECIRHVGEFSITILNIKNFTKPFSTFTLYKILPYIEQYSLKLINHRFKIRRVFFVSFFSAALRRPTIFRHLALRNLTPNILRWHITSALSSASARPPSPAISRYLPPSRIRRTARRCRSPMRDTARCGEMRRDAARCGEMRRDAGICTVITYR